MAKRTTGKQGDSWYITGRMPDATSRSSVLPEDPNPAFMNESHPMIEKIVNELKKIFVFKESTGVGDIVLIVAEQVMYAMVTGIERDNTRKEEWWQVSMQLLVIPPQKITWTLRMPQFSGQEIFTMGGEPRFIKAIDFGGGKEPGREKSAAPSPAAKKKGSFLKVIK